MLTAETIAGFSRTVLSSRFDNAVESPAFHREMWDLFCSKDTKVAIAAPRAHAKTTGGTVAYGLATLLFRERNYMVLIANTEAQAVMFLSSIKDHLQNNEAVNSLFELKRNDKGHVQFVRDSETDIVVEMADGHKFRIMAKGAGQALRGMNWLGKRPDIVICDDLEDDEAVMNKERRDKMKHWFYKALLPCMSRSGIIRVVGTVMHTDSLLENMMPLSYDKWTRREPLKLWSEKKRGGWRGVKYRAHSEDFEHILWPEQYSAQWFIEKKAEFAASGMADGYSQEYLNVPLDEASAFFKRTDFLECPKDIRQQKLHIYITVDLAISQEQRADYSVFVVAGVDENRQIHILQVVRERLDGREIVDQLIALQRIYQPEFVGIEEMQVSKSIGPFLREEMIRTGVFINLVQLKHQGKDKLTRARGMQARMRAKSVFFDKEADWFPTFEDELTKFPRDTHDDQVDAFSYLGLLLNNLVEAPTREEQDEEDFLDELRTSGDGESGRSQLTGY
jgi:predicted phage terminase large subunit-like protein